MFLQDAHLTFGSSRSITDLKAIYDYDIGIFADAPEVEWTPEGLAEEIKKGWKIYAVKLGDEIIAAAFTKKYRGELLTKSTPIKLMHQGNGFSHQIKEFFEKKAAKAQVKKVINYTPADNFRMIALNESHGYHRIENKSTKVILAWEKKMEKGPSL